MFQRILLAYDGSAASQRALIDSDAVAKMTGARIHLVAVVPEPTAHLAFEAGMLDMPDPAEQRAQAKRRLDSGMALLKDHGFEVSGEVQTSYSQKKSAKYNHRSVKPVPSQMWKNRF